MVGENIQMMKDKLQTTRSQIMGGQSVMERVQGMKLFGGNPGILSNFQIGKNVQNRLQSIRRAGIAGGSGGSRVVRDEPANVGRKVVSV